VVILAVVQEVNVGLGVMVELDGVTPDLAVDLKENVTQMLSAKLLEYVVVNGDLKINLFIINLLSVFFF
jgi:hypothetical protein